MGELPKEYDGWHFGPGVRQHIIYQNQVNRVPQEKIYQELLEKGIRISEGQVQRILEEATKAFSPEKNDLLDAAIRTAKTLNTDDTGARHKGKNGYCTVICNDSFAVFKSSDTKSKINFLEMMRGTRTDYLVSQDSYDYLKQYKLSAVLMNLVQNSIGTRFSDIKAVEEFLEEYGIKAKEEKRLLIESFLLAVIIEQGISEKLVLLSDGARQFDLFNHAMCWIHAERAFKKLIPNDDQERLEINTIRDHIWTFYQELKAYKENPSASEKILLAQRFDQIFTLNVESVQLQKALKAIIVNKAALLLVLDHPKTPLHNNASERDIREFVTKRKISGGTRNTLGRERRDTFTSLSKTCAKNGISFWAYLNDRIHKKFLIPSLADLIKQKSQLSASP